MLLKREVKKNSRVNSLMLTTLPCRLAIEKIKSSLSLSSSLLGKTSSASHPRTMTDNLNGIKFGKAPRSIAIVTSSEDRKILTASNDKAGRVDSRGDGNSQTNSGTVQRSLFTDGGFGDVGLPWVKPTVKRSRIIINHNSNSYNYNIHSRAVEQISGRDSIADQSLVLAPEPETSVTRA
jgi:hypothetical protein